MATAITVLHRQGAQGVASLDQVAAFDVENPLPAPQPTVAVSAEEPAEVNAAATGLAVAAMKVARSVEAMVEAPEAAFAAARTGRAGLVMRAMRAAVAATPTAAAAPAVAEESEPATRNRVSLVSITLPPILGGALGVRIWRRKKDQFVLKVKPVQA